MNTSHRGPSDRSAAILHLLKLRTSAGIAELAVAFGVSEMTIRRDIDVLEASGHVIRIPGGARLARGFLAEKSFLEREERMANEKERIGMLAASLVQDGESVVLDSGTTTLYIARYLRERHCTVFTFSLAALLELAESSTVRVEVIGGVYRATSQDFVGLGVTEALNSIRADKVFFGGAGLLVEDGVMVNDPDAPRALLHSARERILVLDSSKLGQEALYRFCGLDSCDLLITDCGAKEEQLDGLRGSLLVQVAS